MCMPMKTKTKQTKKVIKKRGHYVSSIFANNYKAYVHTRACVLIKEENLLTVIDPSLPKC